jgi:proteic killer suppression protein
MIASFRHKGLRLLFEAGNGRGVQAAHVQRLTDILDLLNAAASPRDMGFPGSFLHPLKGKLKGYWSIRVSGNWRVVFRMHRGDAFDVNLCGLPLRNMK